MQGVLAPGNPKAAIGCPLEQWAGSRVNIIQRQPLLVDCLPLAGPISLVHSSDLRGARRIAIGSLIGFIQESIHAEFR